MLLNYYLRMWSADGVPIVVHESGMWECKSMTAYVCVLIAEHYGHRMFRPQGVLATRGGLHGARCVAVEVFQNDEMTADSAWRGPDSAWRGVDSAWRGADPSRQLREAWRQVNVPGEVQEVLQRGRTINHSMWMRRVLQKPTCVAIRLVMSAVRRWKV